MDLPQSVKNCLWSYDTKAFDFSLPNNRTLLIRNVLDYGTLEAVSWLRTHVDFREIQKVIEASNKSEWGKKSLALWAIVFGVTPLRSSRFS